MRHLPSARATSPAHPTRRRTRRRRGTVLLFALGVLAIISIAAVSYVTLVRVDRQSSSAVAKTVGYERQVGGVIDTIGGVLTADLFGNKIVTTDVPSDLNPRSTDSTPIWPRMFEDGEFRDYPFTNFATFNTNLPGKTPKGANVNWVLGLDEVAPPDDAWLSSLDPIWFQPGSVNDQTHWRQITNLRSAYTYDTNGTPNEYADDRWIRGDGKFVDLGQLFLDYRTIGTEERGNPGTNLLDRTVLGVSSSNGPVLPRAAAGNVSNAPFIPMNFASGDTGSPTLDPIDERFWADTDGDLRADARWQLLDSLGNREGLLWVTATRIVDLSAMVNVNSSIEGGYPSLTANDHAEGRTPADIDLYRLLLSDPDEFNALTPTRVYNWNGAPHGRPNTTKLDGQTSTSGGTFSDHVMGRLRVYDLMQELTDPDPSVQNFKFSSSGWYWEPKTPDKRLTWTQRLALWNDVGSAPGRGPTISTPRGPVHPGYALSTMIDLHAFSGANNRSMLTDLEETIDGPDEALGYLPRPEDQPGSTTGPLRSNTRPGDTRIYPGNPNGTDTRPRAAQLRIDPRRYLTTVSGVSDLSPVPVLNFDAVAWDGSRPYISQFFNRKVRLGDFSMEKVPDAFQAFVWALAPLATDKYLTANSHRNFGALVGDNVYGDNLDLDPSYHYGGIDFASGSGPANNILLSGGDQSVEFGPTSGAAFSVLTAGALALNLADATDSDGTPSVARFVVSDNAKDVLQSQIIGDVAYLSTRCSHGDISTNLLPTTSVGLQVSQIKGLEQALFDGDQDSIDDWMTKNEKTGVTMVGAERTAYIGEVFVAAAFESTTDPVITLTNPVEQAGALLAVQMINPWREQMDLDGYELVVISPTLAVGNRDMKDPENLRFSFPAGSVVEPATAVANGESTFLFVYYDPSLGGTPDAYKSVIGRDEDDTEIDPIPNSLEDVLLTQITKLPPKHLIPADQTTRDYVTANPSFVMKMRNTGAGERMTVVLRRSVPGLPKPAVVDIFETENRFFEYPDTFDIRDPAFGFDGNIPYFQAIGYTNVASVGSPENTAMINKEIAGRVILTSSATRPVRTRGASSGQWFSYAAITPLPSEVPVQNMPTTSSIYAHAWLYTIPTPAPIPATELVVPITALPTGRRIPSVDLVDDMDLPNKSAKTLAEPSFSDRTPGAGGWQLFIPDRPLEYVSELGQLCAFANTCKNNELDILDNWATIGQQLRATMDWTINPNSSAANNPYLGVLDMSRFLPTGDRFDDTSANLTRDESLALPLATRVFDCFEALDPSESLAQGRININTAPERVLQVLPLVAPPDTTVLPVATNDRVKLTLQYRDAADPDFGVDYFAYNGGTLLQMGQTIFNNAVNTPPGKTASDLIRRHDQSHTPNLNGPNVQYPFTTGFATAGELAFLDVWSDTGTLTDTSGFFPQGFAFPAGQNAADDGANATTLRLIEGEAGAGAETDGIIDDPEERLALYRAVSNIVSSRSDVYGAWFILRGYDPKVIEAIKVTPGDELSAMLNSANPFTPAYESRWFVIFDRSNVRKPTDRPRVLLKAQLPSSRP